MAKELDKKDWKILELLCTDSRLSHNRIAKLVGLSKNAVTYRIERFKKRGIIDGYFSIILHELIGITDYELLLKINASKEQEQALIKHLVNIPNLMVLDRLSGEWNFVMEFGCKKIEDFYKIIDELKNKFSDIIDTFEMHPILYPYKVEQLPIELVKQKEINEFKRTNEIINLDKIDQQILFELNKDSTILLHQLATKTGITAETVTSRIKKLKKEIILRNTAKINLHKLGYDLYLVMLDTRNLSKDRESTLKSYINLNKRIRYAFMSASRPLIMIYFAAKTSEELDDFLTQLKEQFSDIIMNQKYLFVREQYKYNLFPEGFLDDKKK